MIFISNSSNINIGSKQTGDFDTLPDLPPLAYEIGKCLSMLPSKQLGRMLRDGFMMRLEELQKTCPHFYDFVVEFGALLVRLDGEEDRGELQKINN